MYIYRERERERERDRQLHQVFKTTCSSTLPIVLRGIPSRAPVDVDAQDLRETFKALDANGDGFLTVTELRDGIDQAPRSFRRWRRRRWQVRLGDGSERVGANGETGEHGWGEMMGVCFLQYCLFFKSRVDMDGVMVYGDPTSGVMVYGSQSDVSPRVQLRQAQLRHPLLDLDAVVEGVDADGSGLIDSRM